MISLKAAPPASTAVNMPAILVTRSNTPPICSIASLICSWPSTTAAFDSSQARRKPVLSPVILKPTSLMSVSAQKAGELLDETSGMLFGSGRFFGIWRFDFVAEIFADHDLQRRKSCNRSLPGLEAWDVPLLAHLLPGVVRARDQVAVDAVPVDLAASAALAFPASISLRRRPDRSMSAFIISGMFARS